MNIYRDNSILQKLRLEPGKTYRLDRNENATYFWVFENHSGLGVCISGFTPPYFEEFPNGIAGHLKVRFIARGDDAWEKVAIFRTVFSGIIRAIPGTIDSLYWEEHRDEFAFTRDVMLSSDSSEGHATWQLLY
jgi:predicted secreted protein